MPEYTHCIVIDGWNAALKFIERFAKRLGVRTNGVMPRESFELYLKPLVRQSERTFFCIINDGNRHEYSQRRPESNLLIHFQPAGLIADDTIVEVSAMIRREFPGIPIVVITEDRPLRHQLQKLGVESVDSWTFAGFLLDGEEFANCFEELKQFA